MGRQSLRLACFRLGERISLLPAFGAFTGGYPVVRHDSCKIFVIGDEQVWPVN
jgi:metallophosphoesterase superfamily enzyme